MDEIEEYLRDNWVPLFGFENKILVKSGCNEAININYRNTKQCKKCKLNYTKGGHLTFGFRYKKKLITKYLHICIFESYYKTSVPKGYVVHHIDLKPQNNDINNLILMPDTDHRKLHRSIDYEKTFKIALEIAHKKNEKPILQYTLNGEFVAEYDSAVKAQKTTKIPQSSISNCCLNKRKTAGGYIWKFKGDVI